MPLRTGMVRWKRSKISALTAVWKKLIATLMDDFKAFKTPVEEVTTDVVDMKTRISSA